jgi:hypothetical protein
MLGTVAATAAAPAFEDELDYEGTAIEGDAKCVVIQSTSGRIAALLRRLTSSREGRPAPRPCLPSRERNYLENGRMAREMYRL